MFYPIPGVLAFSSTCSACPCASPIAWLTSNPLLAYNVVLSFQPVPGRSAHLLAG